jgi:hypothetical protein
MSVIKSSKLAQLLSAPENGNRLREAIGSAMPAFLRGLAERGRSAPLVCQEEGRSVVLGREHVCNLCTYFLEGEISVRELEYTASILDLNEDFQYDEEVGEAIFQLADPDVNGEITVQLVQGIIAGLRGVT